MTSKNVGNATRSGTFGRSDASFKMKIASDQRLGSNSAAGAPGKLRPLGKAKMAIAGELARHASPE
jgi:hypothetical protein